MGWGGGPGRGCRRCRAAAEQLLPGRPPAALSGCPEAAGACRQAEGAAEVVGVLLNGVVSCVPAAPRGAVTAQGLADALGRAPPGRL